MPDPRSSSAHGQAAFDATHSLTRETTHQSALSLKSTRRTLQRYETRPTQDASDVLDLPYRMLADDANLEEYTQETKLGVIAKRTISRVSGKVEDFELVTFTVNDPENPKNWSKAYKWYCTMAVAFTCFVVAFNSAVITADLKGVSNRFNVSQEVSLLTITLFVVGFGVGECFPTG
jgi:hypothetical protein